MVVLDPAVNRIEWTAVASSDLKSVNVLLPERVRVAVPEPLRRNFPNFRPPSAKVLPVEAVLLNVISNTAGIVAPAVNVIPDSSALTPDPLVMTPVALTLSDVAIAETKSQVPVKSSVPLTVRAPAIVTVGFAPSGIVVPELMVIMDDPVFVIIHVPQVVAGLSMI
jgi:hypothetical protein